MKSAALALAEIGLSVFPVHGVTENGMCTCPKGESCRDMGKHPRTSDGLKSATTDRDQIETWWERWPDANIGVRTDGLCVVDLDVSDGKHGHESWEKLIHQHGEVPTTLCVKTGSGGQHLYFRGDAKCSTNAARFGGDVDIRGRGGYVIAPPSRHKSGGEYELISVAPGEDTIAEAPAWLLSLANNEYASGPVEPGGGIRAALAGLNEAKLSSSVDAKLARLRDLPRDAARLDVVGETARHLAGELVRKGVSEDVVRLTVRTSVSAVLEERAMRLRKDDANYPGDKRVADDARYIDWAIEKALSEDDPAKPSAAPVPAEPSKPGEGFAWFEGDCDDWLADQPEPKWVCEGLQLMVGRPCMLAGDPSAGKTWLAQHIEMCVQHGLPVLGKYAVKRGNVGHVNYDQSRFVTMRRYADLAVALGKPAKGLRILTNTDVPLDAKGAEGALLEFCKGLTLCTIDSLRTAFPSMDENSSDSAAALTMLRRVSEATGCAFLVLHHLSKNKAEEGPQRLIDRIRGSTAIVASCGSILGLSEGGKEKTAAKTLTCERSHEHARSGRFDPIKVRFERPEAGGFRIWTPTEAETTAASPEVYELKLEHKINSVISGAGAEGLTPNAIDRAIGEHYGKRPNWDVLRTELEALVQAGKLERTSKNTYRIQHTGETQEARKDRVLKRVLSEVLQSPTSVKLSQLVILSGLAKPALMEELERFVSRGWLVREPAGGSYVFSVALTAMDAVAKHVGVDFS